MGRLCIPVLVTILIVICLFSCKKEPALQDEYKLSYGDSILYLRNAGNNIIYPIEQREGSYSSFPEGLQIDESTGAIDLADSETGLRYRVTHTDPAGKKTSTLIVVSGINYTDKYYNLSQGDTIARPIYNAEESIALPVSGSIFDDGSMANNSGCSVKTVNGEINLAETMRNGFLAYVNDDKREIDIVYRLNDRSDKAQNKIRVKLYFYHSMATVAPDLLETLRERDEMGVFLVNQPILPGSGGSARALAEAKPRPPCIIIIAN